MTGHGLYWRWTRDTLDRDTWLVHCHRPLIRTGAPELPVRLVGLAAGDNLPAGIGQYNEDEDETETYAVTEFRIQGNGFQATHELYKTGHDTSDLIPVGEATPVLTDIPNAYLPGWAWPKRGHATVAVVVEKLEGGW